jgi:hypothetical protein
MASAIGAGYGTTRPQSNLATRTMTFDQIAYRPSYHGECSSAFRSLDIAAFCSLSCGPAYLQHCCSYTYRDAYALCTLDALATYTGTEIDGIPIDRSRGTRTETVPDIFPALTSLPTTYDTAYFESMTRPCDIQQALFGICGALTQSLRYMVPDPDSKDMAPFQSCLCYENNGEGDWVPDRFDQAYSSCGSAQTSELGAQHYQAEFSGTAPCRSFGNRLAKATGMGQSGSSDGTATATTTSATTGPTATNTLPSSTSASSSLAGKVKGPKWVQLLGCVVLVSLLFH